MDDEQKNYLDRLDKHKENALKTVMYSMQRIDLLIISISGAGIYVCGEIYKYMVTKEMLSCMLPLKLTGIFFILAIIINFLSQWSSFYSSIYDIDLTENLIYLFENQDKLNDDEKFDYNKNIEKFKASKEKYNGLTKNANNASIICMVIGLLIVISLICFIF